jgi:hypothetical protein
LEQKSKQQLYTQINSAAVLIELDQYPERIRNQKSLVRDLKRQFDDIDQDRAVRELEIMGQITGEPDPATGKAKFSNDKARQAELAKRVRTDVEYIEAAKKSRDAEMKLNQAQDELEMLENKYRSCRYRAEIIAGELKFWAGGEQEENLHQAY